MTDSFYAHWKSRAALRFIAIIMIPLLVAADQLSKWIVMETFFSRVPRDFMSWILSTSTILGDRTPVVITPFFRLVAVWNPGVSFGMLQTDLPWVRWAVAGFTLLCAIVFFVWMIQSRSRLQVIALALIVAGALGNLIDRVRYGAVFDFLDVHINDMHWPAFNIADSCISIGVVLVLIAMLVGRAADNG